MKKKHNKYDDNKLRKNKKHPKDKQLIIMPNKKELSTQDQNESDNENDLIEEDKKKDALTGIPFAIKLSMIVSIMQLIVIYNIISIMSNVILRNAQVRG